MRTFFQHSVVMMGVLLAPAIAFAQTQTLADIVYTMINLMQYALPVVVALAVLGFFWGGARLILGSADSAERQIGKQLIFWGVIALFVIISVWSLVQLIKTTFLP